MNEFKEEFDDIFGDLVAKSKSVTYVCFVLDHSGSMAFNAKNSMDNFNEYLKEVQKEAKEGMQTIVTVIDFDSQTQVAVDNQLVENVKPLDDYWIGGTTALYDAIGEGINTVRRLMDNDPREDKAALFFINTDGAENASYEFTHDQIKSMISELEETKKWTFTFLAEGIDQAVVATLSANAIGNTVCYAKSDVGYQQSLTSTIRGVQAYYSARKLGDTQVFNFHSDGKIHFYFTFYYQ